MKASAKLILAAAMCSTVASVAHAKYDNPKFKTLVNTSNSGLTTMSAYVIKDQASWEELWQQHAVNTENKKAPAVDFKKNMVVGISTGQRPNGCYGVQVEKVGRTKERITVNYREVTPKPDMVCTQAIVTPVQFITIPAGDQDIDFIRTNGQPGEGAASPTEMPPAYGKVQSINKAAKQISIKHSDIPSLALTAATSVFQVKDAALLDTVKPGDKLEFKVDLIDGKNTVLHLGVKP